MEKSFAVASLGLWRRRDALRHVLGGEIYHWAVHLPGQVNAFVGWGGRPSAKRAAWLASRFGKPCVLVEDGFLSAYAPGGREPLHSYTADWSGLHFDRTRPSDLRRLIEEADFSPLELGRARELMARIQDLRLSKYNNAPAISESFLEQHRRGFVLLVDQVRNDASLPAATDLAAICRRMVEDAQRDHPDAALVLRRHPAGDAHSPLARAAAEQGIDLIDAPHCNPWDILPSARAVYTISSHLGFEALMAGRPVVTYGAPFYAGWGLSTDRFVGIEQGNRRSVEQLFAAAYLRYSRYVDIHRGGLCEAEAAVTQLAAVRDARAALPKPLYTVGFSPWRRWALAPFLKGNPGSPVHCRKLSRANRLATRDRGVVVLWGSSPAPDGEIVRLEDGFVRSTGLGADLHRPYSLCVDGAYPYYDARGPSRIEQMLQEGFFSPAILDRAARLREKMVAARLSKYNVRAIRTEMPIIEGRLRILVPGQVVDDASIRFGAPPGADNRTLVSRVRALYHEAFIVYKTHPDVAAGLRRGGPMPVDADVTVDDGGIVDWLAWCDRVETLTSLTGFEALLRRIPVGVHGMPFYAGWGLTEDRQFCGRRTRRIHLDELVAAALIAYPLYIHPASRMPCTAEELVEALERRVTASAATPVRDGVLRAGVLAMSRVGRLWR